jgi:hypothetical protein
MPNLYALLVAIDAYPAGIPPLNGCINDADAMEQLLRTRFSDASLHLLRLNNADAKRQQIINSFRNHLGQASGDDIALFFYAGHGSQVPTGGLFAAIEPSGMNSSIVCYDSRTNGVPDLVDKDMGVLISEVTAKGVHLTTIFDSCHSGSMDRDLPSTEIEADSQATTMGFGPSKKDRSVRKIPRRADSQPVHDYLIDPSTLETAIRDSPAPPQPVSSITLASTVNYVPDQCGLHILLAACETDETANEYYDIEGNKLHGAFTFFLTQTLANAKDAMSYRELVHLVRASMDGKVAPQTPKLESSGNDAMFSNLFLSLTPTAWTDYAIAGLSNLTNQWQLDRGALMSVSIGARYALYPTTAANSDLANAGKAVGLATVTSLTPATSVLQLDPGVQLESEAQYKAVPTSSSALSHIDTWKQRLTLTNPNTQIPATAIDFLVIAYPGTTEQQELHCPPHKQVELTYRNVPPGQDNRPFYSGSITNKHNTPLTVALLAFSGDYSISTALLDAETQRLDPGQTVYLHSGTPLHCSVPGTAKETTDEMLLVISTDWFDATVFKLDSLNTAAPPSPTRSMYSNPLPQQDFTTWRVTFHTTRS